MWSVVAWQVKEVRKTFGPDTPLGKRRTGFADAPEHDVEDIQQSMIEREPITVVVSEKGWIRALKGHVTDTSTLTFKADDGLKLALHAETTDKLLVFSTGGKFYTSETAKGIAEDVRYAGRGVTSVEERELWNMPIILITLMGIVCAEWGYRRMVGLA